MGSEDRGSWIEDRELRMGNGELRIENRESRSEDPGSRSEDPGSRIENREWVFSSQVGKIDENGRLVQNRVEVSMFK